MRSISTCDVEDLVWPVVLFPFVHTKRSGTQTNLTFGLVCASRDAVQSEDVAIHCGDPVTLTRVTLGGDQLQLHAGEEEEERG